MTFVPPVGAVPAPALGGATPVAADVPAQDKNIQAVFNSVNYADLQGEVVSTSQVLGPVGSSMLTRFLDSAKKAYEFAAAAKPGAEKTAGEGIGKTSAGAMANNAAHAGPARQSFGEENASGVQAPPKNDNHAGPALDEQSIGNAMAELKQIQKSSVQVAIFNAEAAVVASLSSKTTKAIGELIKGQ